MCDTCTISSVIHGHAKSIIQLATHRLPEYGMHNDSTKCLNSAIAIAYCLLGDKALQFTRFCDVPNVQKRYARHNPSKHVAKALAYDLLHAGDPGNFVYYIMLTDGHLPHATKKGVKVYEPGHVFIIERNTNPCDPKRQFFHLYQSFIRRYNVDEYLDAPRTTTNDEAFLKYLAEGLVHLFSTPVWDAKCSEFWSAFTMTPGEQYEGCRLRDVMLLCYHKIPLDTCTGAMRQVVAGALEEALASEPSAVFGDAQGMLEQPMTNREISQHFQSMLTALDKVHAAKKSSAKK